MILMGEGILFPRINVTSVRSVRPNATVTRFPLLCLCNYTVFFFSPPERQIHNAMDSCTSKNDGNTHSPYWSEFNGQMTLTKLFEDFEQFRKLAALFPKKQEKLQLLTLIDSTERPDVQCLSSTSTMTNHTHKHTSIFLGIASRFL